MSDNPVVDALVQLSKNAEAGMALVSIAAVDEWLLKLLLTAMRPLPKAVSDRIFDSRGILYDIAPKADIAYAFNLIDDQTLTNLRAIKKVRDVFAHTRDQVHFNSTDPDMVKACQGLPGYKPDVDAHNLFNTVAHEVVNAIDRKTQELTFKQAQGKDGA